MNAIWAFAITTPMQGNACPDKAYRLEPATWAIVENSVMLIPN